MQVYEVGQLCLDRMFKHCGGSRAWYWAFCRVHLSGVNGAFLPKHSTVTTKALSYDCRCGYIRWGCQDMGQHLMLQTCIGLLCTARFSPRNAWISWKRKTLYLFISCIFIWLFLKRLIKGILFVFYHHPACTGYNHFGPVVIICFLFVFQFTHIRPNI